jgi:hypothetical protein
MQHKYSYYYTVGKTLVAVDPVKAKEITDLHFSGPQPLESDLDKIEKYFVTYCRLRRIPIKRFHDQEYKLRRPDERRLFLSVMLRMYNPQVYHGKMQLSRGFVSVISKILKYQASNVSMLIRDVIDRERIFKDYRNKVGMLILKMYENR